MNEVDSEPGVDQRGEDFSESVIPLVGGRMLDRAGADVGLCVIKADWSDRLEIGVLHDERVVLAFVIEGVEHGMAVADVEAPAGTYVRRDDLGPSDDIW
jgi:hypothetical protein